MTAIEQIKTKGIINASDKISWTRIVDVLNEIFHCNYGDYQSASWFPNGGDGEKDAKLLITK